MFHWARKRAGLEAVDLLGKFPKYREWESGEHQPSMLQVADFAKTVHVPITYLYRSEPPKKEVPIPDFRTVGDRDKGQERLSPNLIDTIHSCLSRQFWYLENHAKEERLRPLDFVGSVTVKHPAEDVAAAIRKDLQLGYSELANIRSCDTEFNILLTKADEAGILVMVAKSVEGNNRRPLDPEEFRGFALADSVAPLIFINGKDSKPAQLFTLAHELAHVWLGKSAVSDAIPLQGKPHAVEKWCNGVAAELLVPRKDLSSVYRKDKEWNKELNRLVRRYKVCSLVIVRRLFETRLIDKPRFEEALPLELSKFVEFYRPKPKRAAGSEFRTQLRLVGRRFARAVVSRQARRKVGFRDALELLSLKNEDYFESFSDELKKAG